MIVITLLIFNTVRSKGSEKGELVDRGIQKNARKVEIEERCTTAFIRTFLEGETSH